MIDPEDPIVEGPVLEDGDELPETQAEQEEADLADDDDDVDSDEEDEVQSEA